MKLGFVAGSALFFLVVTVVMTWPLAISPSDHISSRQDYYLGLWDLWWVARAVSEPGLEIFWTDYLFHPFGHGLEVQPLTLLQSVPVVPITLTAGPVVAYNVLVLVSFWMAGWVTSLWVRALTGDGVAGVVAGSIFSFCPFHYTYLAQLNLVPVGFAPLFMLCALAFQRRATWLRAGLSGAALAAVGLASWYYGVSAGIVALILSVARLSSRGRGPLRTRLGCEVVHWGACALVLAPVVLAMLSGFSGEDVSDQELGGMGFVMSNFKGSKGVMSLHSYLGLSALGLALIGCRSWKLGLPLLAMGIGFFVLSMGSSVEAFGREIPMPFMLLERAPLAAAVRYPDRFFLLTQLALAALAGIGAGRLRSAPWALGRTANGFARSSVVVGVLVALPLLEYWPGAMPTIAAPADTPIPRADQGVPGAVFLVPTMFDNLDSEAMFQQISHGRPIPGGYLTRSDGQPKQRLQAKALPAILLGTPPERLPRKLAEALRDEGFAYVAVQKEPLVLVGETHRHEIFGPFSLTSGPYLQQRLFPAYGKRIETMDSASDWIRMMTNRWGAPIADTPYAAVFEIRDL